MGYVSLILGLDIFSCESQPGDYQLAINLAAAGKIDLKPLVTHR